MINDNGTTVTVYPTGVKVEVTPGSQLEMWPDHLPTPQIGVFDWVDQGDGSYKPMIRIQPKFVRLVRESYETMGLGISYSSLRRLMHAGFVDGLCITPGHYSFDIQSFYRHVARVKADPDFWTGKNLKRYMQAAAEI